MNALILTLLLACQAFAFPVEESSPLPAVEEKRPEPALEISSAAPVIAEKTPEEKNAPEPAPAATEEKPQEKTPEEPKPEEKNTPAEEPKPQEKNLPEPEPPKEEKSQQEQTTFKAIEFSTEASEPLHVSVVAPVSELPKEQEKPVESSSASYYHHHPDHSSERPIEKVEEYSTAKAELHENREHHHVSSERPLEISSAAPEQKILEEHHTSARPIEEFSTKKQE